MLRPLLAAVLALAPAGAGAASLYAVEIVVFARPGVHSAAGTLLPELERARDPGPATAQPVAYARLPENALALAPLARRLADAGGYRVLLHAGWWQDAPGPSGLRPVRLDLLGATLGLGATLTGTLGLYRTQVLRVRADVALVDADALADGGSVRRLKVTRGVRVGELHYLDHPTFGVLVQVRDAVP